MSQHPVPDALLHPFDTQTEDGIQYLGSMVDRVRATYHQQGDVAALYNTEEWLRYKTVLAELFGAIDLTYVLVESGIPMGTSFGDETLRIIKSKLLPYIITESDLRSVIGRIFHQKGDVAMLTALFEKYGVAWIEPDNSPMMPNMAVLQNQLENAAKILSYRLAAIGMEEEMAIRAGKDSSLITPFVEQNSEIIELLRSIEKDDRVKAAEDYAQATIMLQQCRQNIGRLDKAAAENGASLQQTFILNKSSLLIDRLIILLSLLHQLEEDTKIAGLFSLIKYIVLQELNPKKLRDFLSRNIQLIAYRITENKRKTGEHYITTGWAEYWDMFQSACGGGLIVSFMVVIKLITHHAALPPLWEALLYSINYAGGFVLIHVLHFTLATKQPAMTAAYIAASLDSTQADETEYEGFGSMIAAVSRSQIASFAGNLLVVFPMSLLWILFGKVLFGDYFLHENYAQKLLSDIHPIFSLSVLYAALAGFYLFFAGLISGFGDNKVMVSKIGLRLLHHPQLRKNISPERLAHIASYTEHNLGPILGNIVVGFLLGMTGFVGTITGLPLDIRHITFSTGNLALGLFGSHFQVTGMEVFASVIGLLLIGSVNFLVSFLMALEVAIRSRGLRLRNYPYLLKSVWLYFSKHPKEFFLPK